MRGPRRPASDRRTSEFRKGYLEPLGITSMLDAPVFLRGKMVGVVCHEHTGRARRWQLHEELLASSVEVRSGISRNAA